MNDASMPSVRIDVPRVVLRPSAYSGEQLAILISEHKRVVPILTRRMKDTDYRLEYRQRAKNTLRRIRKELYHLERERARRRAEREEGT